jgi:hypothetical protein
VTDREWLHDAVKMLGWMLPGEVKVFSLAQRGEATAWVTS